MVLCTLYIIYLNTEYTTLCRSNSTDFFGRGFVAPTSTETKTHATSVVFFVCGGGEQCLRTVRGLRKGGAMFL